MTQRKAEETTRKLPDLELETLYAHSDFIRGQNTFDRLVEEGLYTDMDDHLTSLSEIVERALNHATRASIDETDGYLWHSDEFHLGVAKRAYDHRRSPA